MSDGEGMSSLLDDLPRGRHADDIGSIESAFFEHPDNLAAAPSLRMDPENNRQAKMFLGVVGAEIRIGDQLANGRFPRWASGGVPIGVADDRHHFLLAGSRAGKGRSVLTPNLISLPKSTSVLVLDPKGDLAAMTARWRHQGLGQDVAVTDPFDCSGASTRSYRSAFNAVDFVVGSHPDVLTANAMLVADALVVENEQSKDPHWDESGRDWIGGLIAHVATHANYEGRRDLVTVWQLSSEAMQPLADDSGRYALEAEMLQSDAAGGFVRAAAQSFYGRSGSEFFGVASNARRHLSFIGVSAIQNVLRGPSVDPKKLKSGSLAWYVTSPAMRAPLMRGFQRLVVQMTLAAFEEENISTGHQTVFMLDEFQSLGRLRALETAIAQFAGLGAKLMIVLQDLPQIKAAYPKSWQTFLGNAGVLQAFGGNDDETLSYLSKRLGEALVKTKSLSQPGVSQLMRESATGSSFQLSSKPLLTPSEIELYFARDDSKLRQLILRPGFRPMILQRVFYDQSEYFCNRFDERF
ncbi:type IV secretory system conjugative DNA transfer family protein [Rhodopirellula bahusiensis]|uniref:TRAG family protein n=1 Tax=Rhodopirellula bahusiensis TaxID=2014065 RepID=A0A2G1W248_9BACT|nr:type IV secretory system conjugative DNA transfer family protein [Rhodopirellula bahusiensis]PHQ33118.1 TRAG family protein [Rhodopirellula bahusiensis]